MEDLYASPDFESFYRRYLEIHQRPEVRVAHAVATTSAATLLAIAAVTRRPLLALAAPVVDYAIAQASHRADGRKTQPWRKPSWHLRAELRLFRDTLGEGARSLRRSAR